MGWLEESEDLVGRIAREVGPSVVGVGHRRAVGSGVIVAPNTVLTNAHNLRGEATEVTLPDGRQVSGAVAGVDLDGDLGVLELETDGARPIRWDEGGSVGLGSPVIALSNPGGRGLRVTLGMVSGTERSFRGPRGRRIGGSIEHTSPLLPGSSGGPIVDPSGSFLGLNTNRLGEGFYLAIPADSDLRSRAGDLARGRAPARPRLGVGIAPPEVSRGLRRAVGLPEVDGLLVRTVEEGGPGERAGLAEGDLIVGTSSRPLADADDLYAALEAASGGELTLRVLRGAEERVVPVPLGGRRDE